MGSPDTAPDPRFGTPPSTVQHARARAPAALLIHIGYHKTGTTWLQSGLFADERCFVQPWSSMLMRNQLVHPTPFEFDPEAARATFLPEMAAAASRGLVPVMSDERLSGSPHAGGFDSAQVAERLASAFPEARVVIVIREQASIIYSVYQQYVRDGGAASLKHYLAPRRVAEVPQFRFSHFEYHHLIAHYQRLYGQDDVCVLPYEWLRLPDLIFLRRITEIAGVPEAAVIPDGRRYESLSATTVAVKRWFNLFFVRTSLNPGARLYVKDHERRMEKLDRAMPRYLSRRIEKRARAVVAEAVGDRYSASNAATARLTGLDLRGLGYPVA